MLEMQPSRLLLQDAPQAIGSLLLGAFGPSGTKRAVGPSGTPRPSRTKRTERAMLLGTFRASGSKRTERPGWAKRASCC